MFVSDPGMNRPGSSAAALFLASAMLLVGVPARASSSGADGVDVRGPGRGALSTEERGTARLLLGRESLEGRRHEEAEKLFREAAGDLPLMADYAFFWIGESAAKREAWPAAADAFTRAVQARPDGILSADARFQAAESLGRAGLAREALGAYDAFLDRHPNHPHAARALLFSARIAAESGHPVLAGERVRKIRAMFPLSPEEGEANLLARRLSASGIDTVLGGPDRLVRARRLFDQKRYPAAAEEFLSLLKESPSDTVLRYAARAQFARGRYSEAASLFDRWVKRASTPEARAEGRWWVMRAYGRIDRLDQVDRVLAAFADEEKETVWFGRALILRGKLRLDEGSREEAKSSFRRAAGEFPQDEMIEEALWFWGWAEYEAGAMDDARRAWKKLTAEFPRSALAARAAYWTGRAAERRGNIDTARADYRRVVRMGPSYYGFLAEERLRRRTAADATLAERGRTVPARDAGSGEDWANVPIPERLRGADSIRRAQILLKLGLQGEARRELARANRGCGGEVRCVVAVNDLLIEAGDFRSAVLAFEGRSDPGSLPGPARRQFFPKAYWAELKRFADREEIDPYLVLAVVREESRFDPEAVSRAGALGLMQIMPKTGRQIMKQRREGGDPVLRRPEKNLDLGTWYLGRLREKYAGDVVLSLAGYNAGPGAVDRWVRRFGTVERDEFVERIPYRETREYVKRVLTSYAWYQATYADGRPPGNMFSATAFAPIRAR
ncbi:MAG: hypothetical protein A2V83_10130 [Nitrospirae bacterium RBG_16_64_22]|nr:MAG: hypothetical protein A2V83_10130 [Nitrospirae bacterium RBG_16_64_22]